MSTAPHFYPIGTPGQPWGPAEIAAWRARQRRQRSYADEVLRAVLRPRAGLSCLPYGEIVHGNARYPVHALASSDWQAGRPTLLVTGGVHGYETSGVRGALAFADAQAPRCAGRANLLIVPCVSPWGWEYIQRWNHDAVDPNRSFRANSPAQEARALQALVARYAGQFSAHIDLHETTDSDEAEFRPALAARDGKAFEPGSIPDGFYVVDDTEAPCPELQQAVVAAVARVTHIAPADEHGEIIKSPVVAPGVIRYKLREWGLCASVSGAPLTCTTEVYPDSARTSPAECVAAQVAAVCAVLEFILAA
ncbi:M14 family metallocarboxypeptidase [Comamonas sp. NLF-1-9]|uniref:M14 family metallopeptidase n=1 Tax=Comamonas sp. NLF-1-9 TaxID=2853163 RepID=UPI001C47D9AE|nr:M14 family metallocarboxypeptidase [Comamonas sp. NLF-1-9]QXL83319.1 M14 family metallocarboxypeptidase [Comamonas sp. NLF-1-9]